MFPAGTHRLLVRRRAIGKDEEEIEHSVRPIGRRRYVSQEEGQRIRLASGKIDVFDDYAVCVFKATFRSAFFDCVSVVIGPSASVGFVRAGPEDVDVTRCVQVDAVGSGSDCGVEITLIEDCVFCNCVRDRLLAYIEVSIAGGEVVDILNRTDYLV